MDKYIIWGFSYPFRWAPWDYYYYKNDNNSYSLVDVERSKAFFNLLGAIWIAIARWPICIIYEIFSGMKHSFIEKIWQQFTTHLWLSRRFKKFCFISCMCPASPPYSFGRSSCGTWSYNVVELGRWNWSIWLTRAFINGFKTIKILFRTGETLIRWICLSRTGKASCVNFM